MESAAGHCARDNDQRHAEENHYENPEFIRPRSNPFNEEFERDLLDAEYAEPVGTYARRKHAYEEVFIAEGKPVLSFGSDVGVVEAGADPLSSITFNSPLRESSTPQSDTSSVIKSTPVPAPRPSKAAAQRKLQSYENVAFADSDSGSGISIGVYEELPHDHGRVRGHDRGPSPLQQAPQVPPRGSRGQVISTSHATARYDTNDNVYSELDPPPSVNANLASQRILDNEHEDEDDDVGDLPSLPGRPRSVLDPRLTTIDIRNDFNRLFDDAVQELHRDASLVEYIEQHDERRRPSVNSNSYHSVAIPEARFKIVNGRQVPIPVTLLKDFDPCFETFGETQVDVSDSESSDSASSASSPTLSRSSRRSSAPEDPSAGASSLEYDRSPADSLKGRARTPPRLENPYVVSRAPAPESRPLSSSVPKFSPKSPQYENIWVPDGEAEADAGGDAECDRRSSLGATALPRPREASPDDDIALAKSCIPKYESSSSVQGTGPTPHKPRHKSVVKSASTSNITSIAKKLSLSKIGRKISDQVMRPGLLRESSVRDEDMIGGARPKSAAFPCTKGHSGPLIVFSKSKRGHVQERWAVLSHASLKYYRKDEMAEPKEQVHLRDILSVTKRHKRDVAMADGSTAGVVYCFDVGYVQTILNAKTKFRVRTFGALSENTRDLWVDRVVQSLSLRLEGFPMLGCFKVGWAFLKVMFAGEWGVAWVSIRGNKLFYMLKDQESSESIDLKKTKNATLVKEIKNLNAPDSVPVLVIDFVDRSLYLQTKHELETNHWKEVIENLAFSNQSSLDKQQLTKDEIPVFVEQCINFVFRHGCMSEGIYRHSGVKTKIDRLLTAFEGNAWAVPLTREEFSEHDVANALKRFLRTLQEPLLTERLRPEWIAASKIPEEKEKFDRYRELLVALPTLNLRTLRRIIGHLHTIASQCDRNLMPNYNLAAIWGPTLLTVDGQDAADFGQTSGESDVCKDLIDNYMRLFSVSREEIDREMEIMKKTESFNRNPLPVKVSGEMMMFVYIDTKTGGDCVSVAVTPKMTAHELSQLALRKAKYAGDATNFILHEVVLSGEVERPIHHKEVIYDVTLKWWQWSDADRIDTYLLLKRNVLLEEAIRCAHPPISVFGEAMFAENSRAKPGFKKSQLSMNNAKLTRSKELKAGGTQLIESWDIERLIWYFGCESKRQHPYTFNITFIEKDVAADRSREKPFFGRCISFSNRDFFIKFVAAMLVAEHQSDLRPPATLLNIDED